MDKNVPYSQQGVKILRKKLNAFTSQVHKEITPRIKRLHFQHDRSLKANLKQYNVNIFGDCLAKNHTTGRGINKEVIGGLLHVQKTLETNVSGLLSRVG